MRLHPGVMIASDFCSKTESTLIKEMFRRTNVYVTVAYHESLSVQDVCSLYSSNKQSHCVVT